MANAETGGFQYLSSAWKAGYLASYGDLHFLVSKAFLSHSTKCLSQKNITADPYYISEKDRLDDVMVLDEDDFEGTFSVWFTCAHCLVHVD